MRRAAIAVAMLLVGCGPQGSGQATRELASDALNEAQRANDHAEALEVKVSRLENDIQALRSDIQAEAASRESGRRSPSRN